MIEGRRGFFSVALAPFIGFIGDWGPPKPKKLVSRSLPVVVGVTDGRVIVHTLVFKNGLLKQRFDENGQELPLES